MTLTPKTKLQALLLSAEHWLRNFEDPANASSDAYDCACCTYADAHVPLEREAECYNCPIYEATNEAECLDTPYGDARDAIKDFKAGYVSLSKAQFCCGEEYEFIMNLALNVELEEKDYAYDGG